MTATSSGRLPARNTQAGTLSRVTEVTADEGPSRAQEATRSSTVPGGCWGPGLSHRWAGGPWRGTQPAHGDIARAYPPLPLQSPANLGPHRARAEARRSPFDAVHTDRAAPGARGRAETGEKRRKRNQRRRLHRKCKRGLATLLFLWQKIGKRIFNRTQKGWALRAHAHVIWEGPFLMMKRATNKRNLEF